MCLYLGFTKYQFIAVPSGYKYGPLYGLYAFKGNFRNVLAINAQKKSRVFS